MAKTLSILIIDDDESLRRSLALILEKKGYDVMLAGSGREAIELARGRLFNVMLLDLKLPDTSGISLLDPLKEIHPDSAVIVMTAFASVDTAQQALKQGASGYVIKPLDLEELFAVLEELLEKQRLVAENRRLLQQTQEELAERKRAEAKLINLLEGAPDATLTVNALGEITFVNTQAERLFGYSNAKLIGRPIDVLIPEEKRCTHLQHLAGFFKAPISRSMGIGMEITALRRDGTIIPVEISLSPLQSDGEQLVSCSVRDITERRMLQSQLHQAQKMEVVGQLTGGIAHDFNNLLAVILGNLQLIEEPAKQDASLHVSVQAALDAGFRGAELTKRLLAFSRQQLLEPEVIDANKLVTEMEPLLTRTLGEHVTLKVKLADDLWRTVIDRTQLENSLLNLAVNARDAMPAGGLLAIETVNTTLNEAYAGSHAEVQPGEYVLVTVSDVGTGISKEALKKVLQPFYTTKEFGEGSGLGLSMVHGFVKQSKGHIEIYSEEGHGTTVKLYLPRCSSGADIRRTTAIRRAEIPTGDEVILVVEDQAAVRRIAASLLASFGYRVLEAGSGAEALALLNARDDIDLLFTDMVMPGMTGVELVSRARKCKPDLKVLHTSGYADTVILEKLLESSAYTLNKPYRKEELAQAIREALDRPS